VSTDVGGANASGVGVAVLVSTGGSAVIARSVAVSVYYVQTDAGVSSASSAAVAVYDNM